MREIWDRLWAKREMLDIEEVITYDSSYYLLKRLIESPQDNIRILEVGCGSGIYTLSLLREFQDYHRYSATLIDFSPIALSFARKNAEKKGVTANLGLADAFKLPFHDNTFDIVWNAGVNEHFNLKDEKRQLIFNEMTRVCKQGGQVIVIVPNSLNLPYRLWKKVFEMQGRWEYGLEIPYSLFELQRKMRNAGLIPTKLGGGGTLASISFFGRLLHRKSERGHADDDSSNMALEGNRIGGYLNKTDIKIDRMLGVIGGFTGAEIGVKGIK